MSPTHMVPVFRPTPMPMAGRLAALKGGPGYKVESRVFPGQSHMSVPWEALNSVLNFALGDGSGSPTP